MTAAYPNQLAQKLNPLPVLVLLWGDDAGSLRQAAQQVIAATGVDPTDPFAAEKFTLPELQENPSRLTDAALTPSFTSPHRLIVLHGVSGEEKGEEKRAQLETLTDAVKTTLGFPLQAVTIVLPVPRLLEKTSPLTKLCEAHAQALSVRFFMDNARDLSGFLQTELKTLGKAVEPDALQRLTEGLGADRELARRELEKLVLYAGNDTPITVDHVEQSLAGATAADAFRLADAVTARNPAQTDHLLTRLTEQGEDLYAAFSLTIRALTQLKTAQAQRKEGKSDTDILQSAGKFKAPKDVQAAFLTASKRYPPARLATLADYALETITQSRSGLLESNFVLARALLALSA